MINLHRQGDVLLIPIAEVSHKHFNSDEAYKRAKSLLESDMNVKSDKIVAYGEATGHHHVFEGDVTVMEEKSDRAVNERGQIIEVRSDALLVHTSGDTPDHDVLTIPAGKYLRIIQKQKDPWAGWVTVRD